MRKYPALLAALSLATITCHAALLRAQTRVDAGVVSTGDAGIVTTAPSPADPALAAAQKGIRETFKRVHQALQKGDGKTASSLVTLDTLALYESARKLALDTASLDQTKQGQVAVLMALQLRLLRSRKALEKDTGLSLFSWGTKSGLVSKDTLTGIELDTLQVEGEKAVATVKKDAQVVNGMKFFFMREGGRWKLDLTPIILLAEKQFDQIRKDSGKTETELALYLMEETHKKPMPPALLKGPLK